MIDAFFINFVIDVNVLRTVWWAWIGEKEFLVLQDFRSEMYTCTIM